MRTAITKKQMFTGKQFLRPFAILFHFYFISIRCAMRSAWPLKSRQMSIKSGPKLISLEKWKILTPLTNRLKMWQLGQNICCHRLRKIAQSAINHPIWSHWICCCSPWCRWTGRRASSRREEVRRGESRWGRRTLDLRDQLKWDKQKFR